MRRVIIAGLGVLLAFCFVASQVVLAEEGKPCPKKKIVKKFWCDTCKKIREFNDCPSQDYVWDWEAHKAKAEENPHANLPEAWGCQSQGYYCIRCGKCYPRPGICWDCNDDTESRKDFARVVFRCPDGHEHYEPGTGFKLMEGRYEEQMEDAGNCPTCGKHMEIICTKSGTCPHTT
ncbi:MAG: hypothetical protein ACE5IC_02970 [Candidatus Brocadiales bacterium]